MRLSHAPLVRLSVLMSALIVMSACEGSMEGKEFDDVPPGDVGGAPGITPDGGVIINERDLGGVNPSLDAGVCSDPQESSHML